MLKMGLVLLGLMLVCASPVSTRAYVQKFPAKPKKPRYITVQRIKNASASMYYGPTMHQQEYATGSFRGDVALNGEGKKTALTNRKPRAMQTLAFKRHRFKKGTLIRIPELNIIGQVEDVGDLKLNQADVFAGHGEDAMKKALKWGKRPVTLEVVKLVKD